MRSSNVLLIVILVGVCSDARPVRAQLTPPGPATRATNHPAAVNLGEPWLQTLRGFDEWAQIQQLYTPDQIADMRRTMVDKAANLPPANSEQFRAEVNAKLHILMGAEARDARKWLAATLAVASDSYAQKVRAQLPDVTKDTPAQLEAALSAFEAREASVKQYQQGFEQTRQMQIKAIEDDSRRQAEANAQAYVGTNNYSAPSAAPIGGPSANGRYYSPYRPILPYGIGLRYW